MISLILVKLKKLKYLNIKDNRDSFCVYFILRSIPDDSSLREIVYDYFNSGLNFDVFKYFHERNLNIFPNFCHCENPNFPSSISQIPFFKSLNTSIFRGSLTEKPLRNTHLVILKNLYGSSALISALSLLRIFLDHLVVLNHLNCPFYITPIIL